MRSAASPTPVVADLVAIWHVKLPDGVHRVEFVHGTTSGRRVVKIDGQELRRKNYMFKLVGKEEFNIGGTPCYISIEAVPSMRYQYKLHVNGQTYERYEETTAKNYKIWKFPATGVTMYQIVFDTQTLEIRVNGNVVETSSDFTDTGSQLSFALGLDFAASVRISTANFQRTGLSAVLLVDNQEIPIHHES
ncbi:putative Fas apoptotic inhibitory molecule 1 [Hypsibius exemplaris]|uniref:Fas apoptotic inhibitory molecule 1 n=1 Tax=Hypsibius exemplaris TaxID=2072580 RepID=A0A1W0WUN1_HYPEX|nr:putative Fas apoptotic inhibitory molecule 1 [Hypsibius exemplaris]